MDKANWEVVYRTGSHVEAEVVRGLLNTSNIPVYVEATGQKALPMFFGQSAIGELLLRVPPDLADLAAELIASKVDPESEDA